eukprot:1162062-Pelagomonas_calceolata.AAC.30
MQGMSPCRARCVLVCGMNARDGMPRALCKESAFDADLRLGRETRQFRLDSAGALHHVLSCTVCCTPGEGNVCVQNGHVRPCHKVITFEWAQKALSLGDDISMGAEGLVIR